VATSAGRRLPAVRVVQQGRERVAPTNETNRQTGRHTPRAPRAAPARRPTTPSSPAAAGCKPAQRGKVVTIVQLTTTSVDAGLTQAWAPGWRPDPLKRKPKPKTKQPSPRASALGMCEEPAEGPPTSGDAASSASNAAATSSSPSAGPGNDRRVPPRDMKRLDKEVSYEVIEIDEWGGRPVLVLRHPSKPNDVGRYKLPQSAGGTHCAVGDAVQLLSCGFSQSRNLVARKISIVDPSGNERPIIPGPTVPTPLRASGKRKRTDSAGHDHLANATEQLDPMQAVLLAQRLGIDPALLTPAVIAQLSSTPALLAYGPGFLGQFNAKNPLAAATAGVAASEDSGQLYAAAKRLRPGSQGLDLNYGDLALRARVAQLLIDQQGQERQFSASGMHGILGHSVPPPADAAAAAAGPSSQRQGAAAVSGTSRSTGLYDANPAAAPFSCPSSALFEAQQQLQLQQRQHQQLAQQRQNLLLLQQLQQQQQQLYQIVQRQRAYQQQQQQQRQRQQSPQLHAVRQEETAASMAPAELEDPHRLRRLLNERQRHQVFLQPPRPPAQQASLFSGANPALLQQLLAAQQRGQLVLPGGLDLGSRQASLSVGSAAEAKSSTTSTPTLPPLHSPDMGESKTAVWPRLSGLSHESVPAPTARSLSDGAALPPAGLSEAAYRALLANLRR